LVETRLTCSAGIGCNKMLAKICSDFNKPDGQTYLEPEAEKIREFMRKLNIRKVPGLGRMQELVLNELGIFSCADILENAADLSIAFNERYFQQAVKEALGVSRNRHEPIDYDEVQKNISCSRTIQPIRQYEEFVHTLQSLA